MEIYRSVRMTRVSRRLSRTAGGRRRNLGGRRHETGSVTFPRLPERDAALRSPLSAGPGGGRGVPTVVRGRRRGHPARRVVGRCVWFHRLLERTWHGLHRSAAPGKL